MSRQRRLLGPAVDHEIMPLGFPCDGVVDSGVKRIVRLRCAQWRTQISGIFLTQAHKERAGAGHADTVATLTEIVGEGSYETEPPAGLFNVHIAGGTTGTIIDVFERIMLSQTRAHERESRLAGPRS